MDNTINLYGGDYHITNDGENAYIVKKGVVLVYIIPYKNDEPGRRSFVYEAHQGEVIPSLVYRDNEYCNWRFCFVALESAELSIVENGATRVLKEKFSVKANIRNFRVEGYEGGLVDQYRINTVTEDGFIKRSQRDRIRTSQATDKRIRDAFRKNRVVGDYEATGNHLYDCLRIMCLKQHISIADFEKVKATYGSSPSISEIADLSHFAYREVLLQEKWYKTDSGVLLVYNEKKEPMVCIPKGRNSYVLYNPIDESVTPLSHKNAEKFDSKGFMLYRPFNSESVNRKEMVGFCKKSINRKDTMILLVFSIISALIGLITPIISSKLYDEYIPLGTLSVLFQLGCVMGTFMIANVMFSIVKNITSFRITSRMAYDTQSAVYDRLFNLPESFFRKYESDYLAQRAMSTSMVVNTVATVAIMSVICLIYVIIYLIRMLCYSVKMSIIGLLMVIVYAVIYYLINKAAIKHKKQMADLDGKTTSIMYQLINGLSKLRIAGVEESAIYEYTKPYVKQRNYEEKYNNIISVSTVLSIVANSIFTMAIYIIVVKGKVDISIGDFVAFNTVFGSFVGYSLQITNQLCEFKKIKPQVERLKPILLECPEFDDTNGLPGDLSGGIEINNVTFAYSDDLPNVIEDLSLNVKPGEYLGIVGPSGCGKSTLMKLLLGFEKPKIGKIYYDNKDIESLDKRQLRKKMGVVLQNGKLISGSIFENITITCPHATTKDVKRVIKDVGLEDDIKKMPMGLHTILSEDCGTISGGQQQRILIARAVISNPKILIFDEATSALDNVTQRAVCETLEKMDSTRIVIAHRLSTIINCDRIIVMDHGKIVEQGSYDELINQGGMFAQLASRQIS